MLGPVDSDIRRLVAERTAFGIAEEVVKLGLNKLLHAQNLDDVIAVRSFSYFFDCKFEI